LAAALRATSAASARLTIGRRCAGVRGEDCDRTFVAQWLDGWDDVLVEHRVGDLRRPDIVLRQNGAAIGAIEIVVSNAVSPEKAAALATLGVPWVEVDADERLAAAKWTVADVLEVSAT